MGWLVGELVGLRWNRRGGGLLVGELVGWRFSREDGVLVSWLGVE